MYVKKSFHYYNKDFQTTHALFKNWSIEVCCMLDLRESGDMSISSSVKSCGRFGIIGGGIMKVPRSPSSLLNGNGVSLGLTSGVGLLVDVPLLLTLASTLKYMKFLRLYS